MLAEELYVVRHGQRRDSVAPDWEKTTDRVNDPPFTDLGRWRGGWVGGSPRLTRRCAA